jgi:oligopeptidase B
MAVCLAGCSNQNQVANMKPPVAKIAPQRLAKHSGVRTDNYFWLRDRDNPEVIAYLNAENAYTAAVMARAKGVEEKVLAEFKGRIKQTDVSVPYLRDGYYYYARTEEGKDYPIYCRKKGNLEAPEQIVVDANQEAVGHKYCSVQRPVISPESDIAAYAVDTVGRRFYTIHFKNLTTGKVLKQAIPQVTENAAWANDNKTLFYVKQHPSTLRAYQVYRHVLGTRASADVLVYEEKDETYSCHIFKTKSKKYIMIALQQTLASEYRYLDASTPAGKFKIVEPRRRDHEYAVDHFQDHFYIRTNDQAKNFRLMKTPVEKTGLANWREVIAHREEVLLGDFEIFRHHLVVEERSNALMQLRIRPWSGAGEHYIDFGEPAYAVFAAENHEFDTPVLRYRYSSLTTPLSVFDYHMDAKEKKLLKRQEVLGGFDASNYVTGREWAVASDGRRVPISLVYRKGFQKNGQSPLLLYGYGSYGISMDAEFNPFVVSLLDRGFVYAIAHVRGGQEMGRRWYEDGRQLAKMNTFTDFIACAEHLVMRKYAAPGRVFAKGGSAGGLLMGAVVNLKPRLFKGVIANVPFVDVVTTMLDDTIPLTTGEYDEWGNPNEKKFYDYILSYSPYDQVKAQDYPNLLVTTGLHDSQVQYWEPAKWVAKLRALKTGKNRLLLKTKMEAGHGGASGRYERWRDTAFEYAFVLDLAGL